MEISSLHPCTRSAASNGESVWKFLDGYKDLLHLLCLYTVEVCGQSDASCESLVGSRSKRFFVVCCFKKTRDETKSLALYFEFWRTTIWDGSKPTGRTAITHNPCQHKGHWMSNFHFFATLWFQRSHWPSDLFELDKYNNEELQGFLWNG